MSLFMLTAVKAFVEKDKNQNIHYSTKKLLKTFPYKARTPGSHN